MFDVSDMYTIADVWGWTWEKGLKNRLPRRWSQEWEVELAIEIMQKVSKMVLLKLSNFLKSYPQLRSLFWFIIITIIMMIVH